MPVNHSHLTRFRGPEGLRRLTEVLLSNTIVRNDTTLASKLAAQLKLREVAAGSLIIRQNAHENDLFLIISGELAVIVNGRRIAVRYAGEHVGEMALLDQTVVRSASVIAMTDAVIGKISESSFSAIADAYPILWRHVAQVVSNRLRQRNALVSSRNDRPVLFIGSSKESLFVATELSRRLRRTLTVNLWSQDVFLASRVNIESLETQIPSLDFAVLVLSPDDRVISRHSMKPAPRDNVVFELGLFMGGLGRHRTFLVKPKGLTLKVPTDLLGVTPIEYADGPKKTLANRIAPACKELRRLITRTGTR